MGAALPLIPELEQVIQHGSRSKRVETLQRMTALFVAGADRYNAAHVDLFDEVFGRLIAEIETRARAELAEQIAPLRNAPTRLLRTLAHDDDIAVAGPVLQLAPCLEESDLVVVAQTKGQAHLQAIALRGDLGEAVTDELVRRGDREVAHSVAGNRRARISESGFFRLVKRAESDAVLAEKVCLRPDISPRMFRELLTRATAVVHARLLASAPPDLKAEIRRVLQKVSHEIGTRTGLRDYRAAQGVVLGLHRVGRLDEAALASFANDGKYEEVVVGLAALSKVPIDVADRLMAGERPDPVLILCKAAGMGWTTVKSIVLLHPQNQARPNKGLDAAFTNYDRLSTSTAQRVARFWQVRQNGPS